MYVIAMAVARGELRSDALGQIFRANISELSG
jgi:hypothetical protein